MRRRRAAARPERPRSAAVVPRGDRRLLDIEVDVAGNVEVEAECDGVADVEVRAVTPGENDLERAVLGF